VYLFPADLVVSAESLSTFLGKSTLPAVSGGSSTNCLTCGVQRIAVYFQSEVDFTASDPGEVEYQGSRPWYVWLTSHERTARGRQCGALPGQEVEGEESSGELSSSSYADSEAEAIFEVMTEVERDMVEAWERRERARATRDPLGIEEVIEMRPNLGSLRLRKSGRGWRRKHRSRERGRRPKRYRRQHLVREDATLREETERGEYPSFRKDSKNSSVVTGDQF